MPEETRTIKIRMSTYRVLKVLAAERGEKLMDLIDRLVANERQSGAVVTAAVTLPDTEHSEG